MAARVGKDSINLVLVGNCGLDISATANNIIGEKRFEWWHQQPETYQEEKAKVQGHDLMVVGNPCLKNSDIHSHVKQIATAEKLDDFDAMLFLISFGGRISQEDKWLEIFRPLEDILGTDYIKQRGILIVVPTERYRPDQNNGLTIEEFLQEETGIFQELRETCNNRLIVFDNKTDKLSVLQNQVKRLLDMVTEMKKEGGDYSLVRRRRKNRKHGDDKTYREGEDFITFLLVGKTGQGKSSTGNSILGEKKFKATANFTSTTKQCQREVATVQGQNVVVVDSPGLADTDIETDGGLKQLAKEIINIFATQPDGFDIILITIPYNRITPEDIRVFDELNGLFGETYVNHCGILVITHVDEHDQEEDGPIEEFIKKQKGPFQQIRDDKVKNRVVYFDNRTEDENVRQKQLRRLLNMAVSVKKDPPTSPPAVCKKVQETRDETMKNAGKPIIRAETTDKLTLIKRESLIMAPESKDIKHLENIITKLQQLRTNLEDEVEDKRTVDKLLCTVRNLEEAIRMKISAVKKNDDQAAAEEKIRKELTALAEQLADYAKTKYSLLHKDLDHVLANFIYPVFVISSYFKKIVKTPASFLSWLKKK